MLHRDLIIQLIFFIGPLIFTIISIFIGPRVDSWNEILVPALFVFVGFDLLVASKWEKLRRRDYSLGPSYWKGRLKIMYLVGYISFAGGVLWLLYRAYT